MALITCPECSKQISSAATQCPSCGYPLPKPSEPSPNVVASAPIVTKPPLETHVVIHRAVQDWRGLAKTSWILIAVACLVAIIPVLGFASWFIAGPVFIATFVMAIMILSRGGTAQGVLLLGVSMFAAPAFVFCAPFISSLLGLAGVGAAFDHADQKIVPRQPAPFQAPQDSPPSGGNIQKLTPPDLEPRLFVGTWQGVMNNKSVETNGSNHFSTDQDIIEVDPSGRTMRVTINGVRSPVAKPVTYSGRTMSRKDTGSAPGLGWIEEEWDLAVHEDGQTATVIYSVQAKNGSTRGSGTFKRIAGN
jgi:hypothetical protein